MLVQRLNLKFFPVPADVFRVILRLLPSASRENFPCEQGTVPSSLMHQTYRKSVSEAKVGSAEEKAREILDDALKTAEAKKREALLEAKEESLKAKNDFEKESRERRMELQRYEKRVLNKEETLDRKSDALEKIEELEE